MAQNSKAESTPSTEKKSAKTATKGAKRAIKKTDGAMSKRMSKRPIRSTTATDKKQESLLEKFFINQLRDIFFAEKQQLKVLSKMETSATTDQLKEALEDHLYQTQKQIKRLEKVFDLIGKKNDGVESEAMEGLIKETETIIRETKAGTMTRDAALIIAAQKIEHYEIATYGGLVQLALTMGLYEVADILERTLMEEEDTDLFLTEIAESEINIEADGESVYSWEKELMA